MLEITDLFAGYYPEQPILKGLNLRLNANEKVAVFGQNGAGKSTIGKAIMGLLPYIKGDIRLNGVSIINNKPKTLQQMGIAYFMQGGRVFGHLTASENLKIATSCLDAATAQQQISKVKDVFSFFGNTRRINLQATYLSGGERHQLALAMVFASSPNIKLLIADEPSAGISQTISHTLLEYIKHIDASVILIEQNQHLAKNIISRYIILENGILK
jgi:ABC-type branched-subunit amino acid transport system ATPase component